MKIFVTLQTLKMNFGFKQRAITLSFPNDLIGLTTRLVENPERSNRVLDARLKHAGMTSLFSSFA
jgi:hypothetical protein